MICKLVMIGAFALNPCTVAALKPISVEGYRCEVLFNAGDALTGQYRQQLPYTCEFIQSQLNAEKK